MVVMTNGCGLSVEKYKAMPERNAVVRYAIASASSSIGKKRV